MRWSSIKKIWSEISLYPFVLFPEVKKQDPLYVAEVFFVCNYIGIMWSRGIHYQFIIWFSFSLFFLIEIGYPPVHKFRARHLIGIVTYIELLFSIRPDYTRITSTLVHINMLVVFVRLCALPFYPEKDKEDDLQHEMIETNEELERY